MRSFDYIESGKTLLTPHTTSLLAAIHEAKGRQSIQTTIRPDILETLVAVARIQSTDASNRIEGISTSDSRLNDLVSEKVTPRNRNEEEIAGYRDVLSAIHESHDYIPITPNVILQLHRDLFRHTPLTVAGHFKDSDNVIIERDAHGTSTVRFAPPSALVTPELIERAVLHEFAVEPAIARIADVFEEHAPQVRADLAYTSFVQCGYQFVCHRQTTPQISPACRRCEHLLHIKYVTVHILNYLPHSATPCRLQRVSLYFNIFQNVFQSRLHVFHTYRYIFHSVYRYR